MDFGYTIRKEVRYAPHPDGVAVLLIEFLVEEDDEGLVVHCPTAQTDVQARLAALNHLARWRFNLKHGNFVFGAETDDDIVDANLLMDVDPNVPYSGISIGGGFGPRHDALAHAIQEASEWIDEFEALVKAM